MIRLLNNIKKLNHPRKTMASSPLNLRNSYHARSISLPSKSSPLTLNAEEHLCQSKSSGAASCSSHNLSGINILYSSIEDLLQLSSTQKAISSEKSNKFVSGVLDGSLRLLDICNSTREIFSQIKESVQDLQLAFRRKKEHAFEKDVALYLLARKKVKKTIQKSFSDIKKVVNENESSSILEKDQNIDSIFSVLREVESITLSIFKSLLLSVCSSRLQTTQTGWSLVSKLMHKSRASYQEEEADITEMESIDTHLSTLIRKKSSKGIQVMDVQSVQMKLESAQSSMQAMDEGLECIYRSLIKTRVSLLNILSR